MDLHSIQIYLIIYLFIFFFFFDFILGMKMGFFYLFTLYCGCLPHIADENEFEPGAVLGGGCTGCTPPPEMTCGFRI